MKNRIPGVEMLILLELLAVQIRGSSLTLIPAELGCVY